MANQRVFERLNGIQDILNGHYTASMPLSSATKGAEREYVINDYLAKVLPNQFRFGTGDATDQLGNVSGQLDIVIENSFMPSLPTILGPSRLYLAESIAAVVEVKSDVSAQWDQALSTAKQLLPLKRNFGATFSMGQLQPKIFHCL